MLRLKNRFSRLRTSRFFTQSFTLFILMMGLPVICLGIFSIVTQQEDANARIEEGYNNALENIVTGVESTFSNLSTLATQIPSIPWVEQYIYASDTRITYETLDQLALSDQIQELSVFKVTNNILNGIILSFDDKQFVISSYGRARSENFYGEFLQFGHYQADDWQTLFEGKKFMQMVGPYDSVIYSSSKRLLLCVTSLPAQERSCCAHLIFALDCDKLSAAIENNTAFAQGSVSIYTPQGLHVAGDALDGELLDKILTAQSADGSVLACKDQILFLRKSQTQPLIFAAVLPAAAVRMGVTRITFLSILFMMLYLLCAACASFLLARYLSRPIDRMLQSIPLSGSDENAGNDLVYLENAVHALLQGDQVTRSQLETFKPYALNTLLTQLLFNDLSADAFGSRLCDMLDIQLYYRHFVAMSLLTGTDLFLHDRLNPSFAKAHENDYISIYFCDIDARQKAVIFNYNDQQLLDRLVDSVYTAVCAHTTVRAAGVGASYDSSDALSRSYEEALFALNCRMVDRDLPVLYYRDITLPRSNAVYLPNTDAIISALLAGDAQKALDLAQRQIDASAGKSAAPLGTLRHLYYLLATLAPKALAEQGYPCTQLYQCVNAILSETSVGAMQALLETSYTQGVSQLCAANEIGTLCISDVLSYLHAHYADVSLSLNLTAAHFNVSASYLSRVFKNTVNVNFLDYLNSYRIDQAKTLLHSDATMLTIAQQVGFDNDATFRRLFKKYTGTTPSRYKALRAAP